MKRSYVRTLIVVGVLILAVGSGIAVRMGIARADTPVILDSQINPMIAQSQLIGPAPATLAIHISVGLQMRDTAEFNSLLEAIADPQSPSYQQYLTPDEFTRQFAPTDDQVQQVKDFLQDNGMTVKDVASDNLLLDVNATAAQAEQAFNVQINTYQQGTTTFYANATPIEVPASVSSLMTVVAGLDSSVRLHYNYQKARSVSATPTGYKPKDVGSAYDISPLQNAGFLGDRQTIALFEADGYLTSDVASYVQYFNPASLPASLLNATSAVSNLTNVLVDGYNGAASGPGAAEVSMDIEMVDAIAPRANVLVYEGPNTLQGMNDTYAKIVNDNRAQVVGMSWGTCEASTGNTELQLLDNIFKQGAAQGMSFFAASGDAGAYDCGSTDLGVDSPSSDPYVTSVGGTSLLLNPDGSIASESVWSDPTSFSYLEGVGSGGGLSSYFALPSWERGSGVTNSYSNGKREVPDVSANADSNNGYAIFCTVQSASCNSTGWNEIGGTSAAAPIWAASAILINQYMQTQGKRLLGQANSALFGLSNGTHTYPAFHDITTGTNLYYPATAGYDLASGLGSPDVFNIARDLAINAGGTATTSISTSTAAGTTLAQDTFQGPNQTYWGTTSGGQTWGGDANTSSAFSIANNSGLVTNSTTSSNAILGSLLTTNSEVSFTGTLSSYTNDTLGAVLHWVDAGNYYKAYLDGASLVIQKVVLGAPTVIASAPFTATAGTAYSFRFRLVGTSLYAVVWPRTGTQPANWMIATSDSSLLVGSYGLSVQEFSGGTATFSAFLAKTAS